MAQSHRSAPPLPQRFEIGRHTFFDFGPPFDFYEVFVVRPAGSATSVERILVTPPGNTCMQPATVEIASATLSASVAELLGKKNPCAIPEKELRRERKRCKKCLVLESGANVAMQVQCGARTRVIRADIFDQDMFDPAAKTPEHTSWTMTLLQRLDKAVGPGVMEKPIFPTSETAPPPQPADSEELRDLASGKYDPLFQGAPEKPSDLYRAAQVRPPAPTVKLIQSTPFQPELFAAPQYPPIARLARVEGTVVLKLEIATDGSVGDVAVESGHPMLKGAAQEAAKGWRFPKQAAGQQIEVAIEFATNCPTTTKAKK